VYVMFNVYIVCVNTLVRVWINVSVVLSLSSVALTAFLALSVVWHR